MKRVFCLLFLLLAAFALKAQTYYLPTGSWQYVDGRDTITMYFKADSMVAGKDVYLILLGFHEYIKNGKIVESTLKYSGTWFEEDQFSIVMFGNDAGHKRQDGHISDITNNSSHYIILTKIDPNTISVRLTSYEHRPKKGAVHGYTLPRDFKLTRLLTP